MQQCAACTVCFLFFLFLPETRSYPLTATWKGNEICSSAVVGSALLMEASWNAGRRPDDAAWIIWSPTSSQYWRPVKPDYTRPASSAAQFHFPRLARPTGKPAGVERRASALRRLYFAPPCSSFFVTLCCRGALYGTRPCCFKVHLFKFCRCTEQCDKLTHSRSVDFMSFFLLN